MKNKQIADKILTGLEQLLQSAGPEWTLEFIKAGIAEIGQSKPNPSSGTRPQKNAEIAQNALAINDTR